MAQQSLRVVFDTNAFSPGAFDLLEAGPLRRLCAIGRIAPIYCHIFLEETFRAYGVEGKRRDLVERWLPFIKATADRLCDDFVSIWHRELVQGRGRHASIYMRKRDQDRLFGGLDRIPLDGSWRVWHETKSTRDGEDAKRNAQRQVSKEIRQEIADWKRAVGYSTRRHGVSHFAEFFEKEVDSAGRGFIKALVPCWNPMEVANRWSRAKMAYPYFTCFVVNMIYISHHAATKDNDKIDLNAQADLDLMTHLLVADVVVSDEEGFLKKAFEDLWRPKGKVLLNTRQFAELIAKF